MNAISYILNLLTVILILLLNTILVIAQDYPRVPADMPEYLSEAKAINDAGVYKRSDWRYILQGGNISTSKYKEREIKYNDQGRISEIMNIDQKGVNKSVIIFRYDKRNLPLLETEFLPTGELEGKTKYTYDFKGILKDEL